ncbi:stromal cell-derived factor 2 isoform X2 [Scaptodrosophila lebanonensis]|uniref:Stromal cell-derived factor 2 isoform X2 n=1 Tax=Drosophila lebanonensis TaxID=7225 RepID=A0A6J2TGD7_DROLE|nr:stromal cell-derived factor 2 isoform X2 [Scaptodrosophila lebanonensis]
MLQTLLLMGLALLSCLSCNNADKTNFVTCGSILKLLNSDYAYRLHSHDVKYGSGSGQQSVTGVEQKEDVNSHWVVKAQTNKLCERGEPIACGSTIRLEHLTTKKNLHSHHFSSPLSGEQEVSAYGEAGLGDTGDHWEVVCSNDSWMRDAHVRFRHVDTGAYLGMSGRSYGRPISGQMEIVGLHNPQHGTRWTPSEGLYIVPKEKEPTHEASTHTEL